MSVLLFSWGKQYYAGYRKGVRNVKPTIIIIIIPPKGMRWEKTEEGNVAKTGAL